MVKLFSKYSIGIVFLVLGISLYHFLSFEKQTPSRSLMVLAESVVKETKPTPPQSAIFYATIAKGYYSAVHEKGEAYEYSTSSLEAALSRIQKIDIQKVLSRPHGDSYWYSENPPFSPNVASQERFVIDSTFSYKVPAPPVFMSKEYKDALSITKQASEARTLEEGAKVNFWGGVPGTEQPGGIWQNRLYDVSKKYNLNDKEYAYAQMVIAEAIADAFMECWKVKYTYWTKRPDMVDVTIETAMPNPPFPAYVSGHSTISFAAATVLGALFPDDKELYLMDAEEAKNSRLWAGIHFPHDNEEGEKLGVAVGAFIIKKLTISRVY